MNLYHPDFVVLDGVSDLIADPNSSEQSTSVINDLMAFTKEYDCHVLTVIHANVGSEKARGHLGSEALRKCETAIFAEAKGDVTLCKWAKTRDMRPMNFAFMVLEGLPVEAEYIPIEAKTDTTDFIKYHASISGNYNLFGFKTETNATSWSERKSGRKECYESGREWIYYQKSGRLLLPAKD